MSDSSSSDTALHGNEPLQGTEEGTEQGACDPAGSQVGMNSAVAAPISSAEKTERTASRLTSLVLIAATVSLVYALGHRIRVGPTPTGPWRGEYFKNVDFEGASSLRYAQTLEFNFGKDAPFKGMPKDGWSARWTTCLDLDEETEFKFRLKSDDGSKLIIDGEEVVDNWGTHSARTRSGTQVLAAGVHILELEYFEAEHGAKLKLQAGIDDEKIGSLLPELLRQPGSDPDDPCG